MPIRGRTPKECFDQFGDHVRALVSKVLGGEHHVTISQGADPLQRDMQLGSRGMDYVSLATRGEPGEGDGVVYFSLAQDLSVFKIEDGRYQLKTRQYWYKVFDVQPNLDDEPLFRWEYQSEVPIGKQWCRHHFQIGKISDDGKPRRAITLKLGNAVIDLNRVHTPTGFMLMEYVFRFLFTELRVVSPAVDWEGQLAASEGAFFSKFSAKTSAPTP
jgi:hypothetical protein